MLWAQIVMKEAGEYPRGCELDYLQGAAINKCDGEDGLQDGIILDPKTCEFDAHALVGTGFVCADNGEEMEISSIAATVFEEYHSGAKKPDGSFLWYGPYYGSNLTRTIFGTPGLAATNCTNGPCVGRPFEFGLFWTGLFVKKDPAWDFNTMSWEEFSETFQSAAEEYDAVYGTSNPNLDPFREAGGKMITYHGLVSVIQFAVAGLVHMSSHSARWTICTPHKELSGTTTRFGLRMRMFIVTTGTMRCPASATATEATAVSLLPYLRPCVSGWRTE
jgi:hypothetical protein